MRRQLRLCLGAILLLGLQACVTEMPPGAERNTHKAVQTRLEAGQQYLAAGNREMARRQFSDVVKMDSSVAEGFLGIAQVHELNSEFAEADSNFRKALGKRSINGKASLQLAYGKFLWRQKRFKEGAKYFQLAGKDYDFRDRAEAIYFHGRCLAVLGDMVKANEAYRHAINLRENLGDAHLELADIAFGQRDYQQAQEHFQNFLKYTRQNPRSLWLGIRLERALGHDDTVASYALQLKNLYGSSEEYLEYKRLIGQ